MTALEITDAIQNSLQKAVDSDCMNNELRHQCLRILKPELQESQDSSTETSSVHAGQTIVPISVIKDVYYNLKKEGHKVYLHEIIQGSKLFLQPPFIPPSNPELVARIAKLKIEEENREYKRITRNVDPSEDKPFTFQEDVKAMNRQLTGVLNFLVTVIAGFAFGYKAVEYSVGKNFPMQMMAGLIAGTVIFFVDLYFMVMYAPI